jgi:hypothetical protein
MVVLHEARYNSPISASVGLLSGRGNVVPSFRTGLIYRTGTPDLRPRLMNAAAARLDRRRLVAVLMSVVPQRTLQCGRSRDGANAFERALVLLHYCFTQSSHVSMLDQSILHARAVFYETERVRNLGS